MLESATSNGYNPAGTDRLAEEITAAFQAAPTDTIIDRIDDRFRTVAGAHRARTSKLARFHRVLVVTSWGSAVFVLGLMVGLQVTR